MCVRVHVTGVLRAGSMAQLPKVGDGYTTPGHHLHQHGMLEHPHVDVVVTRSMNIKDGLLSLLGYVHV